MRLWYAAAVTIFAAALLGILQGITEWLPISSDGHFVLLSRLLHISLEGNDAVGFDVLLHGGSLLALLLLYGTTWISLLRSLRVRDRDGMRTIALLALATVPGVIAGMTLENVIGSLQTLLAAGIGFFVTAACLLLGEWLGARRMGRERVVVLDALLMGIAQAIAILPGVSRSGLTIATGRALGLERKQALDFSFLMAAPIIGGAVGKTLLDAWGGNVLFPSVLISGTGFLTSFIVSLGVISILRAFVVRRSFAWFALYLLPLSALLIYISRG